MIKLIEHPISRYSVVTFEQNWLISRKLRVFQNTKNGTQSRGFASTEKTIMFGEKSLIQTIASPGE